ncbi:SMI1/KNR4 family protein [Streptomyces sp. NPDC051183]|uniref:SMI1/KNR4 family protein n=1 Tax=unclassified Streptomyces TaxID=2593676 RepID=UPI003412397C
MDTRVQKGHRVELSRFREVIGAPEVQGSLAGDWGQVELNLGFELPIDYKEFISSYGSGELMGVMLLFHPRGIAGDEGLSLSELWRTASDTYEALARTNSGAPSFPIHPTVGGLIPIGRSISGNHLFLVPPQTAGGVWNVAMEAGELVFFDMGFTDFIWAGLHGEVYPLLDGEPHFERMGALGG